MLNLWENHDLKLQIIANMQKYGGSFVKPLALCILHADRENLQKIESVWDNYLNAYLPEKWDNPNPVIEDDNATIL